MCLYKTRYASNDTNGKSCKGTRHIVPFENTYFTGAMLCDTSVRWKLGMQYIASGPSAKYISE